MSERREYTVFLASPSSDTLDARDAVARVVHRINVDLEGTVHLRLLRWDDPDRSLALSAETNGQVDVIEQIGHPAKCDLVIGIIRHTMGGRLPPERFPHPGGRAWHCTEWEIDQGLQGLAAGTVRTVWRFRDVADFPGRKARQSDAEWAAIDARHRAVSAYFQALNPEPELQRHSVNEYEGVDDLSTRLDSALRGWVKRQLAGPPAQPQPRPFDADALTTLQQTLLARLLSGAAPGRDDADRKLAARRWPSR